MRQEDLADAINAAYRHTVDLNWQTGDVALLDNLKVMHGRRPLKEGAACLLRCAIRFRDPRSPFRQLEFRHSLVVPCMRDASAWSTGSSKGASVEGAAKPVDASTTPYQCDATHRRSSGFPPATESLHRRSMAPQALHTVFAKLLGVCEHIRAVQNSWPLAQYCGYLIVKLSLANNANIVLGDRRHLLTIGGNHSSRCANKKDMLRFRDPARSIPRGMWCVICFSY